MISMMPANDMNVIPKLKQIFRLNKEEPVNHHERLQELWKSARYRGVKIHPCGCRASSKYAGRFLFFANAPSLPVPGCDVEACSCVYIGAADRRTGVDRRERLLTDIEEKRQNMFQRRKGKDVWKGIDK